jgi:hypothetical protein
LSLANLKGDEFELNNLSTDQFKIFLTLSMAPDFRAIILIPSDYYVFASLGHALSEQRFANFKENLRSSGPNLRNSSAEGYEDYLKDGACVASKGHYFE